MCQPTGKLRWDRQAAVGQWASYRAKGCVDGHCVQLGALAWGWPPAWQPLPLWPRPRAVARWPSPPCAQLQLSARQPQPNRRQAALAGLHAVLRWRLRRGPSTCRRLSRTPGTFTLSRRAVLRVDQLEQFLRALGKRRSVCSLSEVSDGALVRTKGAHTRLASSSIDDDLLDALKAANASAWRSGSSPPCVCVTAAQVWCLHTSKNATYT